MQTARLSTPRHSLPSSNIYGLLALIGTAAIPARAGDLLDSGDLVLLGQEDAQGQRITTLICR